jgi:hypothetical protein
MYGTNLLRSLYSDNGWMSTVTKLSEELESLWISIMFSIMGIGGLVCAVMLTAGPSVTVLADTLIA